MKKDKYERAIEMVDNIKYFWNEADTVLLSHTLSDYDFMDCCADIDDDNQDYDSSIWYMQNYAYDECFDKATKTFDNLKDYTYTEAKNNIYNTLFMLYVKNSEEESNICAWVYAYLADIKRKCTIPEKAEKLIDDILFATYEDITIDDCAQWQDDGTDCFPVIYNLNEIQGYFDHCKEFYLEDIIKYAALNTFFFVSNNVIILSDRNHMNI